MGSISDYLEGRIKIRLGALSTSKHGDCPTPFVSSAAASEFEKLLSDPNGYISGFTTFESLENIIKELGISREEFHRRRQLTDIPHLNGSHDIYCLAGQECLMRARELLGADFACTIRLYCVPIGSTTSSTGKVYLNIRKYLKENNVFLAQHWFDKLKGCEPAHVLAIMKHKEVQDAMDSVLPLIGLWDDFTLGNWAKHLATHCSWSIANFWTHIETVWSKIMSGYNDKKHLVDGETFRRLEFCSPSNCEDDRRKVEQWMRSREIFSNISSPTTREKLLRNILTIKGIIPSIRTFEENMRYFSIGAKILQKHLMSKEAMKKSRLSFVSNKKAAAPSLFAGLGHDWKGSRPLVEVSEGCFKPLLLSSPKDLKKILFIQLFLSALRQFPLYSTELPLRNNRSKPLNTMYSSTCVRWLCARAKALGYQNRKITEGLLLNGPLRTYQDVSQSVSPDWRGGKPTLATFCDLQTISFLPTIQSCQSQRATSITPAFVLSDFLHAFFKDIHFGVDFAHADICMDTSIKDCSPSNAPTSDLQKNDDISSSTEVVWRRKLEKRRLNKTRKRRHASSEEEVEIRWGEESRPKRSRPKRRRLHSLQLNMEPEIDFIGQAQLPQYDGQLDSTFEGAEKRNHGLNVNRGDEDNTSVGLDIDQPYTMTVAGSHDRMISDPHPITSPAQHTEYYRTTVSLSPNLGHAETRPISDNESTDEPKTPSSLVQEKTPAPLSTTEVEPTTEAEPQHQRTSDNPVTSLSQGAEDRRTTGPLPLALSHARSSDPPRRSPIPSHDVEMPLSSSLGSRMVSEEPGDQPSSNRESVRSLPLIPFRSNSLSPDAMSSALRKIIDKRRRSLPSDGEVIQLKNHGNRHKIKTSSRNRRHDEVEIRNKRRLGKLKRRQPPHFTGKLSSTLEDIEARNQASNSRMGFEDNTSMNMDPNQPLSTTEVETPPHIRSEKIQRLSNASDDPVLDTLTKDHRLETGSMSFTPVHQTVLEESHPQPSSQSQRDIEIALPVSPLLEQPHDATSSSREYTTTGSLSPVPVHTGFNDPSRSSRQSMAIPLIGSRRKSEEQSETSDQPQTQLIDRESVRSLPCIPLQFSGPAPNETSLAPNKIYDKYLRTEVERRKQQNRKRGYVSSEEEVEIRRGEERRPKRRRLLPQPQPQLPQPQLNENGKRYRETSEDREEIRYKRTKLRHRLHARGSSMLDPEATRRHHQETVEHTSNTSDESAQQRPTQTGRLNIAADDVPWDGFSDDSRRSLPKIPNSLSG